MRTSPNTLFGKGETKGADRLNRPLNDFAQDVRLRLEALERVRVEEVRAEFTTGAVLAVGTAPFPLRVRTPKAFTPRGVVVWRLERDDGTVESAAIGTPQWRPTEDAIEVQYIAGLTASKKYRLTLGVFYVG